jgi:hypothetical protein
MLRRAPYFRQLGLSPAWAKEVRVFGLVDWKTADAGHPGVDPVNLHVKMATQHGPAAPARARRVGAQARTSGDGRALTTGKRSCRLRSHA